MITSTNGLTVHLNADNGKFDIKFDVKYKYQTLGYACSKNHDKPDLNTHLKLIHAFSAWLHHVSV